MVTAELTAVVPVQATEAPPCRRAFCRRQGPASLSQRAWCRQAAHSSPRRQREAANAMLGSTTPCGPQPGSPSCRTPPATRSPATDAAGGGRMLLLVGYWPKVAMNSTTGSTRTEANASPRRSHRTDAMHRCGTKKPARGRLDSPATKTAQVSVPAANPSRVPRWNTRSSPNTSAAACAGAALSFA